MWPFSKTYTKRHSDGREKTLYRNVDDAFPLYIPGWNVSLAAAGNVIDKVNANMKAEYSSAIQGLLFGLDDLNQGLMMTFRSAYVVYQSDPFKHDDFLAREVEKILDEQRHLRTLRIQVDALVKLASLHPEQSANFAKVFADIINNMSFQAPPLVASQQIDESKQIAKKMSEDDNEN